MCIGVASFRPETFHCTISQHKFPTDENFDLNLNTRNVQLECERKTTKRNERKKKKENIHSSIHPSRLMSNWNRNIQRSNVCCCVEVFDCGSRAAKATEMLVSFSFHFIITEPNGSCWFALQSTNAYIQSMFGIAIHNTDICAPPQS